MDNVSLPVKIICGLIVAFFSGVFLLSFASMVTARDAGGALGSLLVLVFSIFVVAFIMSRLFSSLLGKGAAKCVFWPTPGGEPPPDYSLIKARVLKGEVSEAIEELENILIDDPGNSHAVDLLTNVLMDKLFNYAGAIVVLERYFRRDERVAADEKLIMKLSDAYLELGRDAKAIELLRRELAAEGKLYGDSLSIRLKALENDFSAVS